MILHLQLWDISGFHTFIFHVIPRTTSHLRGKLQQYQLQLQHQHDVDDNTGKCLSANLQLPLLDTPGIAVLPTCPNLFKRILSFFSLDLYKQYSSLLGVEKGSLDQCLIMVALLNYYTLINLHLWCSNKPFTQDGCLLAKAGLLRRLSRNAGWVKSELVLKGLVTLMWSVNISSGWNVVQGWLIRFLSAQFEKDTAVFQAWILIRFSNLCGHWYFFPI